MTMFEIFTKEVEINGQIYKMRPLSGRFIKPFFELLKNLEKTSGKEGTDVLNELDSESMEKAHNLAMETFKKSYPDKKEEELDEFITQNLLTILPHLAEINLPKQSD